MAKEPVITDKDVISLVRKEFERKLKDFCDKNGIEVEEPQEETPDEEPEDSDDQTKRDKEKKKKPEILTLDIIQRLENGTRISHKESGLDYYVATNDRENKVMDVASPENYLFKISYQELMDEYKLG